MPVVPAVPQGEAGGWQIQGQLERHLDPISKPKHRPCLNNVIMKPSSFQCLALPSSGNCFCTQAAYLWFQEPSADLVSHSNQQWLLHWCSPCIIVQCLVSGRACTCYHHSEILPKFIFDLGFVSEVPSLLTLHMQCLSRPGSTEFQGTLSMADQQDAKKYKVSIWSL